MLGFSIKFSLKTALAVASALAVAIIAATVICHGKDDRVSVLSEQDRLDYICSLGYTPSDSGAEAGEITIPLEFSEVYENYNRLQQQAGFDLAPYKGDTVMRYTYYLTDYPAEEYVVINLLVQEEKIIGGDVSSRRLDGFMLPLTEKQDG